MGKLIQILTRGNGKIGTDITHKESCFIDIPKNIITTIHTYRLRGEAFILKGNNHDKGNRAKLISILKGPNNIECVSVYCRPFVGYCRLLSAIVG